MTSITPNLKTSKTGSTYYLKKDVFLYLLILPGILYYILFKYIPMFGIIIAFKDYQPFLGLEGIFTSDWVGFSHFKRFFASKFSWELIRNTFLISFYKLIWGFPVPVVFALLLNEVRNQYYKKLVQTISYLPHFLSTVIVCGMIRTLTSTDGGLVNAFITTLGYEPIYFLGDPRYFRSILVISDIWQGFGWGSIIYLAAMTGIDQSLYEAAEVDGAGWLKKMWHITLPGILPVMSIMLIFRVGGLLDAGFEQIFLLYSPQVYSVADVISTYVYREGLVGMKYSFTTAVNLFISVISLIMVLGSNYAAKKMGQEGIW